MEKYWFRQKKYGYGVTPISWEGWLVTIFLALIIISLIIVQHSIIFSHIIGLMIVILEIGIIVSIFLICLKDKTEGSLGWKWGRKK